MPGLELVPGSERSLHGKQGLLELGFGTASLEWRRESVPSRKGALRRRGEWTEEATTGDGDSSTFTDEFDPINVCTW